MVSFSTSSKKKQKRGRRNTIYPLLFLVVCVLFSAGFVMHRTVNAYRASLQASSAIALDPNIGIKPYVEEFFTQNNAKEMLSILNCESGFKQLDEHGEVLKNRAGSSAVGVAQIIASKHPDPKVLDEYNQKK
jgi:Flp pilus assembly protein TadG